MTMLTLREFQDLETGTRLGGYGFDLVLRPTTPPLAAVPVSERMESDGADGYRTRLLSYQPRGFIVVALSGYSSDSLARLVSKDLQGSEGTFGTMIFDQAGLNVRLENVQMIQVQTRLLNEELGLGTVTYAWTLVTQMRCLYHLPYRAQTKTNAAAAGAGALSGAAAGFASGSQTSPSVTSGSIAGAGAGASAGA